MKARHFVCMAALMMPATPVLASDFSYSYVGIGYNATSQDNIVGPDTTNTTRQNSSGLDFTFSWLVHENLFVVYDYRDHDFSRDELDFQRASLGLGYRESVGRGTDVVAVLRVVVNAYDDTAGDTQFDPTGGVSLGLRHAVNSDFEFGIHVDYVYEGAFEDDTDEVFVDYTRLRADTSLRYEALYTLVDNFGGLTGRDSIGLTLGGNINDDFRTVAAGLRYSF
jgi:hypothetical protein